jgi:hypothetical protein
MSEQSNLISAMFEQMNRAREILSEYRSIPQGAFGAAFIQDSIARAEKAISENDIVAMVRCLEELKEIQ